MTKSRLLCSVAAILTLGAGAAYAQQPAAQPAPSAQQSAPAEKTAPPMHAGQDGPAANPAAKPETTGQAPSNLKPGTNENTKIESPAGKAGGTTKGEASEHKPDASPKAEMKGSTGTDTHASDAKAGDAKSGAASNGDTAGKASTSTTGQGAAGAHANLTSEQRTKITTVIKQHKVEPVKLDVDVRVGTRIPEHVHYYPLPAEVVTIYPQWRGFDYIIVGDTIVVIDPGTREIVAVIDA